jgi:hypothetical protein
MPLRRRFQSAFFQMPLSFIFAAEDDFHCRDCLQDFQPILRFAAASGHAAASATPAYATV